MLVLKLLVSLLVIAIIAYRIDLHQTLQGFHRLGAGSLFLVLSVLCLQQFVAALRWYMILRSMGERFGFLDSARIFITGNAAGMVLVTSIGGLSVRAILSVRAGIGLKRALFSIGIEKLLASVGLLVCFVLGAVYFTSRIDLPTWGGHTTAVIVGVAVALCSIAALIALVRFRSTSATEFLDLAKRAVAEPATFGIGMLLSLIVLLLGFESVVLISLSLNLNVSTLLLLSIQPVVAIMAALPISLGGWGLREGGMVVGMGLLGVGAPDALAVAILYGLLGMLAVLVSFGIVSVIALQRRLAASSDPDLV